MKLTERNMLLIAVIIIAIIVATFITKKIIKPKFQEITKSLQLITPNKD